MKRFLTSLFLLSGLLMSVSVSAKWDKEDEVLFAHSPQYRYVFDMDGTDYNGTDSISFVEYTAVKEKIKPEELAVFLKYLGAEVKKGVLSGTAKKLVVNPDCEYVVNIHLDYITDKAGMRVTVNTYVGKPENGKIYTLKVDDGRWNKIDVLLRENAMELGKKIAGKCLPQDRYNNRWNDEW